MAYFQYRSGDFLIKLKITEVDRLLVKSEKDSGKLKYGILEGPIVDFNGEVLSGKKAVISVIDPRHLSIDRRFFPSVDTPWEEIKKVEFGISPESLTSLRGCRCLISEANTGNVYVMCE